MNTTEIISKYVNILYYFSNLAILVKPSDYKLGLIKEEQVNR